MNGYIVELESQIINTIFQPVAEIVGVIERQNLDINVGFNQEIGPIGPPGPQGPPGVGGGSALQMERLVISESDLELKYKKLSRAPETPLSVFLFIIGLGVLEEVDLVSSIPSITDEIC